MKKILLLTAFLIHAFCIEAQIPFFKQEGPNGGSIAEVAINGSSHIFIRVLNPNQQSSVYRSTNNGNEWIKISIGTNGLDDYEARDILIDANDKLYILGKSKIYKSSAASNGDTWTSVTPPSPFISGDELVKTNDGELYIRDAFWGVFKSNDDGDTWADISNNLPSPNYTAIIAVANDIYLGVLNTGTYKLPNNTSVWSAFNTGITLPDQAASFALRGAELYQTNRDGVYRLNGSTWEIIGGPGQGGNEELPENFNSSDHGVVLGSGTNVYVYFESEGKLYKSTSATTGPWVELTDVYLGGQIMSANAFQGGTSIFVGYKDRGLLRSIDDGANWDFSDNGITFNNNKSFIKANTTDEFFVADGGPFLHTSNSLGFNWNRELLNSCSTCAFSTLIKLGNGNILAIGNQTYRSTNNGASWSDIGGPAVYLDNVANGTDTKFYGHNLNGSTHTYYVSTSATPAATWSTLNVTGLPANYDLIGFAADGANNLYFLTDNGPIKLFKVVNGQTVASEITDTGMTQMTAINNFNGALYLSGFRSSSGMYEIAKTTNGGSSWTYTLTSSVDENQSMDDFTFLSSDIILGIDQGGVGSKLFYSNDAGITWVEVDEYDEGDGIVFAGGVLDENGYVNVIFSGAPSYRSNEPIFRPNAPTNLKAIGSSEIEIVLEWDHDGLFVNDFAIARRIQGEPDYIAIDTVYSQDMYYVDEDILEATNYQYRVTAVSTAGSSDNITVNVTSGDDCELTIPDNRSWTGTVPAAFSNTEIGIRKINEDSYLISDFTAGSLVGEGFSAEVDATFFENCGQPFIDPTSGAYPDGVGTWSSGTNTLTLKFQTDKNQYTPISNTITLVLNANDPAPEKPENVRALILSNTSVEVSWTTGFFQSSYSVGRSTSMGGPYIEIATVNYPESKLIDSGPFVEGTEYFYRVRASNSNLTPLTEDSDEVSVVFKKPNFVISSTTLSNFVAASIGSYWADMDGDGEEDYLTLSLDESGEVLKAKLSIFRNLGNGDFVKIDPVVLDKEYTFLSVIDYNNDGFDDLIFPIDEAEGLDFYTNNGDLTFTSVSGAQLGDAASIDMEVNNITWAEINNDGLLDLMLLGGEDSNPPRLYKQNSNNSFTQIAGGDLATDLDEKNIAYWADYNQDGFTDVLIVSTDDPVRLYRNAGNETFTRVTGSGFSTAMATAASWGDYNNDSKIDLFLSDPSANAIYLNNGNETFTQNLTTSISEVNPSLSSTWGDFNNDGFLDLLVAGFFGLPTKLFLRDPGSTSSVVFTKIDQEKINDPSVTHFSAAHADYDKNGFLDIGMSGLIFSDDSDGTIAVNNNLYKNNNSTGNWVEIKLVTVNGNKSGVGSKIKVVAGGNTYFREITAQSGQAARNSLRVHVGLGAATSITSIEIKFPAGPLGPSITKTILDQEVNQIITISEDTEGPQFSAFSPKNRDKGFVSEEISVNANDAVSVSGVSVVYRPIGGEDFVTDAMSRVGSTNEWKISIQEGWYDDMGMEFYFEAVDPFGNTTRSPATSNHYSYFNYKETNAPKFPTTSLVFGGTESTWNIVSIPFDLGTSATVTSVLDELGAFDNTLWRLLTYQNQTEWAEFPSTFSSFNRGTGYFLNVKTPPSAGITIADEILAPQNNQSNLFLMNLNPGWNQIGNPYLVNVNWADVKAFNSGVSGVGDLKVYSSNGRSYGDGSILEVYRGGFVFANQAVSDYKISFPGQSAGGRKREAGRIASTELDADNWRTMFTLKQSDVTFTLGGIGMNPEAKLSYDDFDDVTVPRLNDFLEMNFHHPEHFAKRFSRDVVPTQEEYTWQFTVDSNLDGLATLQWDNTSFGANENELYLLDVAQQKPINMRDASAYTFDANISSQFKVYFGEHLAAKIQPEKIKLGKAYPNPTSGLTTIPFTLPEATGSYHVRLEVYDMVGRRVDILQNGLLPAGFYESEWDSTNKQFSNGLYTYRLVVAGDRKNEVYTDKIILNK
ncbi:MAG: FG-GAP-like repeat-containing protein [Cyclobacteriaceae bacterium]